MTFLGMSAFLAGSLLAATGAVVGFLYWLKPPARRLVVPSRLLWNRLLREKRKSSILERLRWLISLMIALFIGLSVATAIGRPEVSTTGLETRAITIVIDNSATMSTRMSDGFTRWDHAVEHARRLLQGRSADGEFLIVDTSGQAPPTAPGQRPEAFDVLAGLTVSLGGDPPVNVRFLVEGQEETGGQVLFELTADRPELLCADVALVADGSYYAPGWPSVEVGVRGLCYAEIVVRTL